MSFIHISQVNGANFSAPNAPSKPKAAKNNYTRLYLMYNYGTQENPSVAQPLFEMSITQGTVKGAIPQGGNKLTWKLNLRVKDERDRAGCSQVDIGIRNCLAKWKAKYGLFNFSAENPGDLRTTIFYGRDKETGEIFQGTDPILSLKHDDNSKYTQLKPVLDAAGNPVYDPVTGQPKYAEVPIDYKTLDGKEITCSVVVCARDLYHSQGLPAPQFYVRSCMVLNISDKGSVDHVSKSESVRQYLMQNPDILNTLAEQIEKLKTGQTSLLTPSDQGGQLPPASSSARPALPAPSSGMVISQQPPAPAPAPQPSVPNLIGYAGQVTSPQSGASSPPPNMVPVSGQRTAAPVPLELPIYSQPTQHQAPVNLANYLQGQGQGGVVLNRM